jgi:hypothetical protein
LSARCAILVAPSEVVDDDVHRQEFGEPAVERATAPRPEPMRDALAALKPLLRSQN